MFMTHFLNILKSYFFKFLQIQLGFVCIQIVWQLYEYDWYFHQMSLHATLKLSIVLGMLSWLFQDVLALLPVIESV